jgi:hypothetical protein
VTIRFVLGQRKSLTELIVLLREESRQRHEERMAEIRLLEGEFRKREEERAAEARKRDEEFHEFNREILLRNEKVYTDVLRRMEKLDRKMDANVEATRSNTEETRAQTKALLKLIDRFDPPGGAIAA